MLKAVVLIVAPELTQSEFNAMLPLVPLWRQEKIKRFRFFGDARNSLLGDILARIEICRATGLHNSRLEFAANSYGKPFLANNPYMHYNISHAGRHIACALGDKPVGIDIELVKPIDLKIAERFFSSDEAEYITEAQHEMQTQRFFEVWTMKESRIKQEGIGLSKPLSSFSVFDAAELKTLAYHNVFRNSEAICHVCSCPGEKPCVNVISTAALMRDIEQEKCFSKE